MVARPTLSLLIIKHKIQEYRTIWGQYQVINFKYFNHFQNIRIFHEYPNPYNQKDPPRPSVFLPPATLLGVEESRHFYQNKT